MTQESTPISNPVEESTKPKTEKELAKEAKKKEKMEKFLQKQAKLQQTKQQPDTSKPDIKKEKKEKKEKQVIEYDKKTAPGEKKDISGSMPDSYSPKYVEAAWYEWWSKSGFFKPEYNQPEGDNPNGKFVMVIPPPNVTGFLHLGHGLTCAIEDSLVRWNRMRGKTTLWVPGCDHAGIATQVVIEKLLWRERKLTRYDLGREAFLEEIWKYKNSKGDRIYEQFKKLGISSDWDRVTFTMDDKSVRAVNEAFIRMHAKGLIYRSNRLVNWCTALKSAISDIEVNRVELSGRTLLTVPGYDQKVEFGVIISFAYPVEDSDEKIVVATTRIETMLGDTAVAVHPNDERYKHLHGKFIKHPFVDRRIPIITDDYVDMNFGTGAVKITPAHDPNDFEIGKRHNLPFINILSDQGTILPGNGEFSGMKRFQARVEVLEALKKLNLYIETKENAMVVPVCQRSQDIIEPLMKVQWYVDCKDMAARAMDAVRTGELKLYPERTVAVWNHWLEKIRDWCISRQLWWGHRIPAYLVTSNETNHAINLLPEDDRWICGLNQEDALQKAAAKFQVSSDTLILKQDEDVLDTWFSSGLFPLSTMGWPEVTPDFLNFYPGTLLETGIDIIFFWVARMVMMGLELADKLPFKTVFFHSIVRDAHGRKMSKSLGNVIDPLDVIRGIDLESLHQTLYGSNLDPKEISKAIEGQKQDFPNGIPECGTDAMRYGLLSYCAQGRDINLDIKRIEGYRFFCNKLWNAIKLCLLSLGDDFVPLPTEALTGNESEVDKWILSRLNYTIEEANKGFELYNFSDITTACYNFWLYEFCDVYLEHVKPIIQTGSENAKNAARQTLFSCINNGLRLLHPMMPFITEELYQRLPKRKSDAHIPSIVVDQYPTLKQTSFERNEQLEKDFQFAISIVHKIRSLRSEYNLTKQKVDLYVKTENQTIIDSLRPFTSTIQILSYSSSVNWLNSQSEVPKGCAAVPITDACEAHLNLSEVINVEKEIVRLSAKKEKIIGPLNKLKAATAAADYQQRVPEEVRNANAEKLQQLAGELEKVEQAIASITFKDQ